MDFKQAVRSAFTNYATVTGRASRSEYWYFVLFALLGGFATGFLDSMFFGAGEVTHAVVEATDHITRSVGGTHRPIGPLNAMFSVLVLIPAVCLGVRRLHDTNRSGWWMLLVFVPLVGPIILLIWYCTPGMPRQNRFGANPLGSAA